MAHVAVVSLARLGREVPCGEQCSTVGFFFRRERSGIVLVLEGGGSGKNFLVLFDIVEAGRLSDLLVEQLEKIGGF